MSVDNYCPLD